MVEGRTRIGAFVIVFALLAELAPVCAARADTGGIAGIAVAALDPPASRPSEGIVSSRRCTADGTACIRRATYIPDVCRMLETAARANALDPHFLARLIWKESLFDASAISPAGAQGIAQFMPGTAALRGLRDPFNPAEALHASAEYLAEMRQSYGNIGLAAIAYNGGEARAERFIAKAGGLPAETRAYVQAITGHGAEVWRDAPPEAVDLALAPERAFQPACIALAANRRLRAFSTAPPVLPWGVIVASHRDRAGAERQAGRLRNRHATVLGDETVTYTHSRVPGMPRRLYMAQIGRTSRAEADALCNRLRRTGGDCMVLRN